MEFEYSHASVRAGGIRPGEVRANVFDFVGGLRLICSVEKKIDGKRQLHVSASFGNDTQEYKNAEILVAKCRGNASRAAELWAKTVEGRIRSIAGSDADGLVYHGIVAPGFIPHWTKELPDGSDSVSSGDENPPG